MDRLECLAIVVLIRAIVMFTPALIQRKVVRHLRGSTEVRANGRLPSGVNPSDISRLVGVFLAVQTALNLIRSAKETPMRLSLHTPKPVHSSAILLH